MPQADLDVDPGARPGLHRDSRPAFRFASIWKKGRTAGMDVFGNLLALGEAEDDRFEPITRVES
jgi:hypothetical protein